LHIQNGAGKHGGFAKQTAVFSRRAELTISFSKKTRWTRIPARSALAALLFFGALVAVFLFFSKFSHKICKNGQNAAIYLDFPPQI